MGEAKRRRLQSSISGGIVYHHTSTLRTNLLWMSGVVEVEGKGREAHHPQLGVVKNDVLRRRAMQDFPPLAWFTAEIAVPNCLRNTKLYFTDSTGEVRYEDDAMGNLSDAIVLNRVAVGFRLSDCPSIVKWSEHPGYGTAEGKDLNESARDYGDDPSKWYVSEQAIDLLNVVEFWSSRKIMNPKLQREDWYVKDLHNMVRNCREQKGMYILPTWLKSHEAKAMAAAMGVPAIDGDQQVPAHLTRPRAGE